VPCGTIGCFAAWVRLSLFFARHENSHGSERLSVSEDKGILHMALTLEEFLNAVEKDRASLAADKAPVGVATCKVCGIPLQESVTGNRPDQKCSDCYFEEFGEELDQHPIALLRATRGT
jgi:hypothetical protein